MSGKDERVTSLDDGEFLSGIVLYEPKWSPRLYLKESGGRWKQYAWDGVNEGRDERMMGLVG